MSDFFMNLINLLIIPMLTLYILLKDVDRKAYTKFDYLSKYSNCVIFNLLITKLSARLLQYLFKIEITTYSFYYTIIGIFVAIVLAFVARSIELNYQEKKQNKAKKINNENKEAKDEDKKA